MSRKVFINLGLFLFLLLFSFSSPSVALAHVLETDGSIGAILHISPDDDPIAGTPTDLFLEFKDKNGKFSHSTCDCTYTIRKNSQILTTAPLHAGAVAYTFPEVGIYELEAAGVPTSPDGFQKFKLTYTIRVSRESSEGHVPTNNSTSELLIYLGIAAILAVVIFIFIRHKKTHLSSFVVLVFLLGMFFHVVLSTHTHHDHQSMQNHACCLTSQTTLVSRPVLLPPITFVILRPIIFSVDSVVVVLVHPPARSPPLG